MTHYFDIFGQIVDTESEKSTSEDLTPQQFSIWTGKIKSGETLEITINSPGGSVTGGLAIAGIIRDLSKMGVHTICRVEGLCASIATVIMCACDEVKLSKSALILIHNCWGCVQGNYRDLENEIAIMKKMNQSIIAYYKSKWQKTNDELQSMMDAETWMTGQELFDSGFDCVLSDADCDPIRLCASIKNFKMTIPEKYRNLLMEEEEKTEEEKVEKIEQEIQTEITENEEKIEGEKVEEETEEEAEKAEETEEEKPTYEELEEKIIELEKIIEEYKTKDEQPVEARVSGMQSTMQAKINALDLDYKNRISEYENQLKVATEELDNAKNESISLKNALDETKRELSEKISALSIKDAALTSLNMGVLSQPSENKASGWGDLSGDDFKNYMKRHGNILKITSK